MKSEAWIRRRIAEYRSTYEYYKKRGDDDETLLCLAEELEEVLRDE